MKRVKVALDANVPERTVRMLNSGFRGAGFEFHWEPSFAHPSAEDEFWAVAFQRFGGSVVIFGDKNIGRRLHQIEAFRACGMICFFCNSKWSEQDMTHKCSHLIFWWPKIQVILQTARPRDCWWVPMGLKGECEKLRVPGEMNAGKRTA